MANGETKVTLDKDGNIRVVLGDKLKEGLKKTGLNPNPKNFTKPKSSYKKIYTFTSLLDYNLFEDIIQLNHLQNGMFFLMREGIFPNWEDPDNSEGCCISFKIQGQTIKEEFCKILLLDFN